MLEGTIVSTMAGSAALPLMTDTAAASSATAITALIVRSAIAIVIFCTRSTPVAIVVVALTSDRVGGMGKLTP